MPRKVKLAPRRKAYLAKREAKRTLEGQRFSSAVRAVMHKPKFVEEADGQRVRVWSDATTDASGRIITSLDVVTDEDVRAWLLNMRVVTLRSGLEFCHPKYIAGMIRDGFLRKDDAADWFWVTDKAAQRWNLPRIMGCKFPPATGAVGRLAPLKELLAA
jgi:hypothetical protein